MDEHRVPSRAETLELLRILAQDEAMILLPGDDDGYGARWTLLGQQVQPGIARWLTEEGYIAETGVTELGAHILRLTETGVDFLADGERWWAELGWFGKLKARVLG